MSCSRVEEKVSKVNCNQDIRQNATGRHALRYSRDTGDGGWNELERLLRKRYPQEQGPLSIDNRGEKEMGLNSHFFFFFNLTNCIGEVSGR